MFNIDKFIFISQDKVLHNQETDELHRSPGHTQYFKISFFTISRVGFVQIIYRILAPLIVSVFVLFCFLYLHPLLFLAPTFFRKPWFDQHLISTTSVLTQISNNCGLTPRDTIKVDSGELKRQFVRNI